MHSNPPRARPRRGRVPLAALAAAASSAAVLAACGGGDGDAVVLNVYLPTEPSGTWQQAIDDCQAESGGRYQVRYNVLPAAADQQRQQMVRRLAAEDDAIDILGLDVNWVPEFAEAGWIREWSDADRASVERDTLDGPLDTATWKGKLYAAPYNTNTQLLWYRADLVPNPPETWDDMIRMADDLAEAGQPSYIEIQGAQYEGLTVWFNSLVASAGGSILSEDGQSVTLNDGGAGERALDVMSRMARSGGADPSLSNTQEDQARLAMENGVAAFELNYPFVYPSMRTNKPDLFADFKWAPWPSLRSGEPSKVTIGGIDLAVSAFTRWPEEAFEATMCIRNEQHQLDAAIRGGLPPTLGSLYDRLQNLDRADLEQLYSDPAQVEQLAGQLPLYPFADDIRQAVDNGAVRPKTPAYQNVSIVLSHALSPPSSVNPSELATELEDQIADALESKGLIP